MIENPTYKDLIENIKWHKIWENENPTATFAAQTLELDLSAYQEIRIYFIITNSSTYGIYVDSMIDGNTTRAALNNTLTLSSVSGIYMRDFIASYTGIEFQAGYNRAFNSSTKATANATAMIPVVIWAK